MALCDHETGGIGADELVLGGSQDDSLRTLRIGAPAQEVVGRILLTEAVGNLTDALVHIPEERLVQRETLFLLFLHRETLASGRRTARASPRPRAGARTPRNGQHAGRAAAAGR